MRKTTVLAVFLVMLNASAGFITASGIGAALDINPSPGGGQTIEQANQSVGGTNFNSGGSDFPTLIKAFISAAGAFVEVIKIVTIGGPLMLANLGWPNWLIGFLFAPWYLVSGLDLLYIVTGRAA
jgi:hypothetical protein